MKQQLRAAANAWAKSTIGNSAMDDLEMLDIIQQGSDEELYYRQLAKQIARFVTAGNLMKTYRGAIPLLDAYYYYGRATANDLKSPGSPAWRRWGSRCCARRACRSRRRRAWCWS